MSYSAILKEIARGVHGARNLSIEEADRLYGAMLDGGVPEMELGAILIALRMKGESADELLGFYQALESRLYTLALPAGGVRPVAFLPITVRAINPIWSRCWRCCWSNSVSRYCCTARWKARGAQQPPMSCANSASCLAPISAKPILR
jgi:Anthranilate phosphoribosyltransferase